MQVAQAVHAAFQFAQAHPSVTAAWLADSQTIVVLNVADEAELVAWGEAVHGKRRQADRPYVLIHEPDLGGEATALAIAPDDYNVHFAGLPLAGKVPMLA